jgi:hypothetical protein
MDAVDDPGLRAQAGHGLRPWQFFVLAALACATAVTFLARGQGVTAVVLLTVLMGAAALAGMAALRAIRPLVSAFDEHASVIGHRTRAALEREKLLTLRAIKELEFDRAMGKLSEDDFREMSGRLRGRAAGLIRQLDEGSGYRARIERDLARRIGETIRAKAPAGDARSCGTCATANDGDAKFCKNCGAKL